MGVRGVGLNVCASFCNKLETMGTFWMSFSNVLGYHKRTRKF